MAKEVEFPVVLQKDGVSRTAHTPIAYQQLKTEGFSEGGARKAPARKPAAKKVAAPAETESK